MMLKQYRPSEDYVPIVDLFVKEKGGKVLREEIALSLDRPRENTISLILGSNQNGNFSVWVRVWHYTNKNGRHLYRDRLLTYEFNSIIDAMAIYENWNYMAEIRKLRV